MKKTILLTIFLVGTLLLGSLVPRQPTLAQDGPTENVSVLNDGLLFELPQGWLTNEEFASLGFIFFASDETTLSFTSDLLFGANDEPTTPESGQGGIIFIQTTDGESLEELTNPDSDAEVTREEITIADQDGILYTGQEELIDSIVYQYVAATLISEDVALLFAIFDFAGDESSRATSDAILGSLTYDEETVLKALGLGEGGVQNLDDFSLTNDITAVSDTLTYTLPANWAGFPPLPSFRGVRGTFSDSVISQRAFDEENFEGLDDAVTGEVLIIPLGEIEQDDLLLGALALLDFNRALENTIERFEVNGNPAALHTSRNERYTGTDELVNETTVAMIYEQNLAVIIRLNRLNNDGEQLAREILATVTIDSENFRAEVGFAPLEIALAEYDVLSMPPTIYQRSFTEPVPFEALGFGRISGNILYWLPDGQRVAFYNAAAAWVLNTDPAQEPLLLYQPGTAFDSMAISPDNELIALTVRNVFRRDDLDVQSVLLFDSSTGEVVRGLSSIDPETEAVEFVDDIRFSADGSQLLGVISRFDGPIAFVIWDVASGEIVSTVALADPDVLSLNEVLYNGTNLVIFDLTTRILRSIDLETGDVAVEFGEIDFIGEMLIDAERLYVEDDGLAAYDLADGTQLWLRDDIFVTLLSFDSDGNLIVSSFNDTERLNPTTGETIETLNPSLDGTAISPTGELAVGYESFGTSTISFYETEFGAVVRRLSLPTIGSTPVLGGNRLAFDTFRGYVIVLDIDTLEIVATRAQDTGLTPVISSDGTQLVTVAGDFSSDTTVRTFTVYDIDADQVLNSVTVDFGQDVFLLEMDISPDFTQAALVADTNEMFIVSLETGDTITVPVNVEFGFRGIFFTTNGVYLFSSDDDGTYIQRWDATTGEMMAMTREDFNFNNFEVAEDAIYLTELGTIRILDPITLEGVRSFVPLDADGREVMLSYSSLDYRDGQLLVIPAFEDTIKLIDIESGRVVGTTEFATSSDRAVLLPRNRFTVDDGYGSEWIRIFDFE